MTDRELLREARDVLCRLVKATPFVPIAGGISVRMDIEQVRQHKDILARIDAALAAEDATIPRAPRDVTTC